MEAEATGKVCVACAVARRLSWFPEDGCLLVHATEACTIAREINKERWSGWVN
jgi:hypothetical protein